MALEVPVVATRVNGVPLVQDSRNGLLVEPGDLEGLTAARPMVGATPFGKSFASRAGTPSRLATASRPV